MNDPTKSQNQTSSTPKDQKKHHGHIQQSERISTPNEYLNCFSELPQNLQKTDSISGNRSISYLLYKIDFKESEKDNNSAADMSQKTSIHSDSRLESLLDISRKTRNFEIDLYWKRTTYYWGFMVAIFAGYSWENANSPLMQIVLSFLGFCFATGWYYANSGSKYWQQNWEDHVTALEEIMKIPIHSVRKTPKPLKIREILQEYPYSVTKINQLLSLITIIFWAFIFCYTIWYSTLPAPVQKKANYLSTTTGEQPLNSNTDPIKASYLSCFLLSILVLAIVMMFISFFTFAFRALMEKLYKPLVIRPTIIIITFISALLAKFRLLHFLSLLLTMFPFRTSFPFRTFEFSDFSWHIAGTILSVMLLLFIFFSCRRFITSEVANTDINDNDTNTLSFIHREINWMGSDKEPPSEHQ